MPCIYNPMTGDIETLIERYAREAAIDRMIVARSNKIVPFSKLKNGDSFKTMYGTDLLRKVGGGVVKVAAPGDVFSPDFPKCTEVIVVPVERKKIAK